MPYRYNPFTGKLDYYDSAIDAAHDAASGAHSTLFSGKEATGVAAAAIVTHNAASGTAHNGHFTATTAHGLDTTDAALKSGSIAQFTTKSHTALTDIGTNAHSVVDTHLAATGSAAHGATATPTANQIAVANASGKLAAGWGGSASTLATLDANTKVVCDPANAQAAFASGKIPIAGAGGIADGWLTSNVPLKNAANVFTANVAVGSALANRQMAVTKTWDGALDWTPAVEINQVFANTTAASRSFIGCYYFTSAAGSTQTLGYLYGTRNYFYSRANVATDTLFVYDAYANIEAGYSGSVGTLNVLQAKYEHDGAGTVSAANLLNLTQGGSTGTTTTLKGISQGVAFTAGTKYSAYLLDRSYIEDTSANTAVIANQKSTGAIFDAQDNGTSVAKFDDGSKIAFFNVTTVARQTALTTQLTTITHTAPGTPDYAIADFTQTTPWGWASQDEARTTMSVIANLQTRMSEAETKLKAYGLFT